MESLLNSGAAIKHWLRAQMEAQEGSAFLWCPVWLAAGIGAYFAAPVEPPLWTGLVVLPLASLAFLARRSDFRMVGLAVFLVVLGFAAAQWRAQHVRAPVLQDEIRATIVEGRIRSINYMNAERRQVRVVLDQVAIEDLAAAETPARLRLTLRSKEIVDQYQVGERIKGMASLNPPSPPVIPGGFDFQAMMYFQSIGGLGFFFKPPEIVGQTGEWSNFIEGLQHKIDDRVFAALPGREGAVASALLTGHSGSIAEADLEAMRASGLSHMLAISGMNVALFAGAAFFAVRLCLAMIPWVALHWPIKKIAAIVAFVAAFAYMFIAGATLPTQRAVIMIGVVFVAVLIDRSALSLRLVAFAAFLLLLFFPESLLSISFQMSFAAVIALIWVFEVHQDRVSNLMTQEGGLRRALLYVVGIAVTSAIATIATAPFAFYHFHQIAVYAVIANVLATPIMSFFVMPLTVAAYVALCFGLEYWVLWAMGKGIFVFQWIADWVASWDYALMRLPAWPFATFILLVIAFLWIVLVRGAFRWLAAVIGLCAILLAVQYRLPDILVSEDHTLWAYRGDDGSFYVSAGNKDKFVREAWEAHFGLEEGTAARWEPAGLGEDLRCDAAACRLDLRGQQVSFVRKGEALEEECQWAQIVIAKFFVDRWALPSVCQERVVIDRGDSRRSGVHAVYLNGVRAEVESVDRVRGRRMWNAE